MVQNKIVLLLTRPTSFPTHPGPNLGESLFCLNSACGKGWPRPVGVGGPGHGRKMLGCPSPIFSGCCCFSFGVHPKGPASRGLGAWPGLQSPRALHPKLFSCPKPPPHLLLEIRHFSAFAQSPSMWTGHRTVDWSPRHVHWSGGQAGESGEGTPAPSGQETWNPGHLALLPVCSGKRGRGWQGHHLLPPGAGPPTRPAAPLSSPLLSLTTLPCPGPLGQPKCAFYCEPQPNGAG